MHAQSCTINQTYGALQYLSEVIKSTNNGMLTAERKNRHVDGFTYSIRSNMEAALSVSTKITERRQNEAQQVLSMLEHEKRASSYTRISTNHQKHTRK